MMHPALTKLIYMRLYGWARYFVLGLRTPKKAMFTIVAMAMFCLWLGPQVMMTFWATEKISLDIQPFIPLGLLLITGTQLFTSANERAVMFHQNEIDFLFPAPFTRRQLLLFKIITSFGGVLFSSLIFTVVMMRFVEHGLLMFFGFFLALSFVHLLSMSVVLLRQTVDETLYARIWHGAMYVVVIGLVYLGWQYRMVVIEKGGLQLLKEIYNNPYCYYVLAPFDVFGYLITNESWFWGLCVWLPVALGINLFLLIIVFQLDQNYLEVSLQVSQKLHKRVAQVRRGGSVFVSKSKEVKKSFRAFPRMNGVGTIAWRQYLLANRNMGSWLFTFFLMMAASIGAYFFTREIEPATLIWIVLGILIYFSLFITQYIKFDFRSDLDQFDWLKQMPVSPAAIATGEIVIPVVFLTLLEAFTFSLPFALRGEFIYWFYLILLILPFNVFLVGVDNFIFLLFPVRQYKAQGDFGMFGKIMLLMFLKMIILFAIFAIAMGIGLSLYWVSGYVDAVLFLSVCVIALLETLMVIPVLAWAFERFDVSSDLPPA